MNYYYFFGIWLSVSMNFTNYLLNTLQINLINPDLNWNLIWALFIDWQKNVLFFLFFVLPFFLIVRIWFVLVKYPVLKLKIRTRHLWNNCIWNYWTFPRIGSFLIKLFLSLCLLLGKKKLKLYFRRCSRC